MSEYQIVCHLNDIFSNMPTLALLATITLTLHKNIHESLKLRFLTWLYQKLLDRPNITYMIIKIIKPKYENLSFIMLNSGGASAILKRIIFVNDIKNI